MNALQRDLKKLVPLVESLGAEKVESDPHRQRFHVQPTVGWLNDPNGLCQLHGLGLYDHIHSVDDGAQIRRQFGVVHGRHPLAPIRAAICRRSSTGASKNAWPHIK